MLRAALARCRSWDRKVSERVTRYVAISELSRERIAKYLERDAEVVYPPVEINRFSPGQPEDFFLIVCELVRHIRLVAGAELELMHREMLHEDDIAGLRLGDGPYTRVELPFTAIPQFAQTLLELHSDVHPAILAHPERCLAFHQDPQLLSRLVAQGMLAQVTAASISGAYGPTVRRSAWSMREQGLVRVVASDAHDAVRRPPLLREPLEDAGLGELVGTLCEDGPAAILAGERPAPAPPITPSRAVPRRWLAAKLRAR